MADLISKSELIRDLEKECDSIIITPFTASYELRALKSALRMAIKRIEKAPAFDAVEVVRCKDCKHYVPVASAFFDDVMCCTRQGSMNILKTEHDYCSWGERKDNG